MNLRTRLGHLRTTTFGRGEVIPVQAVPRQPAPLRTSANILNLLEEMTAAVWADPFTRPAEKARAVGYLPGIALKAIEANNLASRVQMLEAVLKLRPGGSTS
jgi:hypothetical protein